MCFTGSMSLAFAAIGLYSSWWIWTRTDNWDLACGVFFFFTMEFLQAIQYGVSLATNLNDESECGRTINQILTMLGFLHICLQPYYCHVINCALTKSCKYKDRYMVIKRLCLVGGFLLFMRLPLTYLDKYDLSAYGIPKFDTMGIKTNPDAISSNSTEWLRGDKLCTFKDPSKMWHLGWSVPMADPSYYVMGASIHSFLMFVPFLVLYEKPGMILQGCFLFLFGPVMASLVSPNHLMEQASIWCFFSIAQISTMLFLIREVLITEFGKGHFKLTAGKSAAAEVKRECDFNVNNIPKGQACAYCGAEGKREKESKKAK